MNIVHLSDFHLNPNNLSDWEMYIKDALISLIRENTKDNNELFIICTGDLIDKGGKDYGGVLPALNLFKDKVINPLIKETGISLDRFIITPGNHDIDRNADDKISNAGLRTLFSSDEGVSELNKYAKDILISEDKKHSKRMIPFKQFEANLYKDYTNIQCSFLGTNYNYTCSDRKVCFNAINSSWLAYDDEDSNCGIAVSEVQYNQLKKDLKDDYVKIALMHHPMDWLKYERNTIEKWLYTDYDIMLVGHVHESDSSIVTKLSGTMFTNVAPCFTNEIRSDRKSFANGVTLIDYNPLTRHIICK